MLTHTLAAAAALATPALALAQWTVTSLHPAGAVQSYMSSVAFTAGGGTQQTGYIEIAGVYHAALWSGTAGSFVDLHPAGTSNSILRGTDGVRQVGWAIPTGLSTQRAAYWTGTAASYFNLHPPFTAGTSEAGGVFGDQMVGVFLSTSPSALLWQTSGSVNLGPSSASATDGTSQVGYARTGSFPLFGSAARMWFGTSTSGVSMEPFGSNNSSLSCIRDGRQGGQASFGGVTAPPHAGLWAGTAASFIDLHPAGAEQSTVRGVVGNMQVGSARYASNDHAAVWTGTAGSYVDLHTTTLTNFTRSLATGIVQAGGVTLISGYGFNNATNRDEALLWRSVPVAACDPDFTCDGNADQDDVACLITEIAGNPGCGCQDPDFNRDGNVDQDDVAGLINVIAGGGCP